MIHELPGLEIFKALVKRSRGTLIALNETNWEPIYIYQGREEKVSVVELYDRQQP
jgi:hypothetical protein